MRIAMQIFLLLLIVSATAVLCASHHGYAMQDRLAIASPASRSYPAGTDELGRDRSVRTAAALLLGLTGACAASGVACALSLLVGGLASLGPGWAGRSLVYAGDLFLTLPWIFLLMLVRAALPLTLPALQSGAVTFALLALLGTPAFLRINFYRASSLRTSDWMFFARAGGLKASQMFRHAWPHFRSLFWTQFILYVPVCVIAEANLGALGLGIAEPVPSWGNMLGGLQAAALVSPSHLIYLPLAVLVLVLTSLELILFGAKRVN